MKWWKKKKENKCLFKFKTFDITMSTCVGWSNLSYQHYYYWTLLLSLAPLPASNIWSKSVDYKLTTSILFLLLVRCSMTSSIFKGDLRISLFPLSSSDIFSFCCFFWFVFSWRQLLFRLYNILYMWNSWQYILLNSFAWEHQDWNYTESQRKKASRKERTWKELK